MIKNMGRPLMDQKETAEKRKAIRCYLSGLAGYYPEVYLSEPDVLYAAAVREFTITPEQVETLGLYSLALAVFDEYKGLA